MATFMARVSAKEAKMRMLVLALSATAMAVPVSMALPTDEAQAQSRYYRNGTYYGPTWRGRDGRIYCRRSNGTTGLIVGGAAGALIGRELDGGRSRATGTILGAAAGALIGREVARSRSTRRCR
jgi:outer membrane lipoprotein SlyB